MRLAGAIVLRFSEGKEGRCIFRLLWSTGSVGVGVAQSVSSLFFVLVTANAVGLKSG